MAKQNQPNRSGLARDCRQKRELHGGLKAAGFSSLSRRLFFVCLICDSRAAHRHRRALRLVRLFGSSEPNRISRTIPSRASILAAERCRRSGNSATWSGCALLPVASVCRFTARGTAMPGCGLRGSALARPCGPRSAAASPRRLARSRSKAQSTEVRGPGTEQSKDRESALLTNSFHATLGSGTVQARFIYVVS